MVLFDKGIGDPDPLGRRYGLHFGTYPVGELFHRFLIELPVVRQQQPADRIVRCIEHELVPLHQMDILRYDRFDAGGGKQFRQRSDSVRRGIIPFAEDDSPFGGELDPVAHVGRVQSHGETVENLLPSEGGGQDSLAFDSVEQRENYRRGTDDRLHLFNDGMQMVVFRGDDDEIGRADFIGASIRKRSGFSIYDNAIPKIAFFPLFIHQERQRAYRVQTLTVESSHGSRSDDDDILHLTIISSIREAKRSSSLSGIYSSLE